MNPRLTQDEVEALPPKARRDSAVVDLYKTHDYLTAYALHTDRRVLTEGAGPAAGADASRDNWDSHGNLQRDFLVGRGLLPHHRLLEIGCGGGRLARKVATYLLVGNYHGVDISAAAVAAADNLAKVEGWASHRPRFWWRRVANRRLVGTFDYVWAHSVFTHLPPSMIEAVMTEASALMVPGGSFYWTYAPSIETVRYGLMQFRTTVDDLRACAQRAGLTFEEVPDWVRAAGHERGRWAGEQQVILSQHAP